MGRKNNRMPPSLERELRAKGLLVEVRCVNDAVRGLVPADEVPAGKAERGSHYHKGCPVRIGGLWFASKREARHWGKLVVLAERGLIQGLRRQVRFKLVVNGVLITTYVADFGYTQDGRNVVEDAKGYRTREYKIKRALMLAVHGITVSEV